ncbi:MAG: hypothetical protein PVF65_02615 [Sphingomonadales bacterium]|jgi:hypothetical protein
MKIAYLASQITIPNAPNRRVDAFEHDLMMETLNKAGRAQVTDIAWDDDANWSEFDAVIIGTCWDYQDRFDEFLDKLDCISQQTALFNPLSLIKWNADKSYLKDLEQRGARIIPTLFHSQLRPEHIEDAFQHFDCGQLVVKRQVGASSEGQFLLRRNAPLPQFNKAMMLQPFMPTIESEGEISFIFIGNRFSHAVLKTPAQDDYRIQSAYGGREHHLTPSPADIQSAQEVLKHLDEDTLYARVDMLRGEDGTLYLMELELIEPYLYPEQCDNLGINIICVIEDMLS